MSGIEGKVIAITGAASGMGLQAAKLLGSKGAKLSLADVQEGPVKAAAEEIEKAGGKAIASVVDVRDRKQCEAWIEKTVQTYGKIDGCANLAGVIGKQNNLAPIEEIDDDDWDFGKRSSCHEGFANMTNKLRSVGCKSEGTDELHASSDPTSERWCFNHQRRQRGRKDRLQAERLIRRVKARCCWIDQMRCKGAWSQTDSSELLLSVRDPCFSCRAIRF